LSFDLQRIHRFRYLVSRCCLKLSASLNSSVLIALFSTASIPGIIDKFHVSQSTATLGLSLYVIGYGTGPIIFSPLSEIPSIGRRPIYIITLFIFIALQVPTLYANNIHTLLAMRFFAGFFGSPALATGGATIQDMCVPVIFSTC
jgi:DHA1 family multidrug resistance protein-like MFS transporter